VTFYKILERVVIAPRVAVRMCEGAFPMTIGGIGLRWMVIVRVPSVV